MAKFSTGLRNKLLDTGPLKTIFNLGFLEVWGGTVPTDADQSTAGCTLLCRFSNNNTATGLTFASTAANGALTKNLGETWSKAAAASGTPTFARLVGASDTQLLSTTDPRIQLTVGLAGADLDLSTMSFNATTVYTCDSFAVGIPAA